MSVIRHGTATWPGAELIESCSYTTSHGISPGTAILRLLPQANPPAETGTLQIGDGVGSVTIPDCKIDAITVQQEDAGFVWSLQIVDRRWKWRDLGRISGAYNQTDPHGKLIPWTIRSPEELAKLCLAAMGEKNFKIDLPPGLTKKDGLIHVKQGKPPWIGVTPTTGTNPPVNWEDETPAMALQRVCDLYGRRVIYQLATNSVLIAVSGRGGSLPDGSIARRSPSANLPETPAGIGVVGSPTKYQSKWRLEAVGEEWDGSYRKIEELSYTPVREGKPAIWVVKANTTDSNTFFLWINDGDIGETITGCRFSTSSASAATAVSTLAAAINASNDPRVKGVCTATAAGTDLTITGAKNGSHFAVWGAIGIPVDPPAYFVAAMTQSPVADKPSWEFCIPPLFFGVRETDRLTRVDAMRLAQKSVYRTYRLTDTGPTGKGPIVVPGYGQLRRRQQVVLTETKVEQVVPEPLDPRLVNADFQQIVRNLYNGYSRDKPATCTGSSAKLKNPGGAFAFWYTGIQQENFDADAEILVEFSIIPQEQIVRFSAPIYRTIGARFIPAEPILETGVFIRNAETNALECYQAGRLLPNKSGNTNFAFRKHPDIQLNVIGEYNAKNQVTGFRVEQSDQAAVDTRRDYYLDGLAKQFPTVAGETREYNGIVPVDLDGAISQVTWDVGGGGASTIASANTEHALYIPPYPARRRAEFLRPAQQAALENNIWEPFPSGGS